MEGFARLIEAFTKLVTGVAPWAILGTALWWTRHSLRDLIDTIAEFKIKGPGFEASGKKVSDVAVPLAVAQLIHEDQKAYDNLVKAQIERSLSVSFHTAEQMTGLLSRGVYGRSILWVDDNPSNNVYERQSLDALGLGISMAHSTDAALNLLGFNKYDLLISDMSRPEGDQAGYDLLQKMQSRGHAMPVIFYTSASSPELSRAAVERGAYGQTNQPDDLVRLVVAALHR